MMGVFSIKYLCFVVYFHKYTADLFMFPLATREGMEYNISARLKNTMMFGNIGDSYEDRGSPLPSKEKDEINERI